MLSRYIREKVLYHDKNGLYMEVVENELIDKMVDNLYDSSSRYAYDIKGSATGKDYARVYYENLYTVTEAVYETVSRSGFARYRGETWFFTGKVYEQIPNNSYLRRAMKLFLRRIHAPADFVLKSLDLIIKEAYQAMNNNRVLKPRYNLMAFRNGVVDMTKGELMSFGQEHHVVYLHDYDYDPGADCPMWKEFLRGRTIGPGKYDGGVLPDKNDRTILQMFLGLGLYDRGTMDKKVENSLVLFGNGSNGKSVIMDTVMGIFGGENISNLSMEALLRGGDERQRNLSQIEGKVFNWSGEMEARTFAGKEDAAKSLISGEPQLGRRIGNDAFKITNIPYFIFNANHFPTGNDSSYGFFRRFIFIVFDRVIDEKKQNLQLTHDLKKEYPGILNWIRRGALLLKKNKFKFPESEGCIRKRIVEMGLSALGKSWAMARGCFAFPRRGVPYDSPREIDFADMYKDILRYAEINEFPVPSKQSLAAHLRDVGFGKESKRRVGKTVYYRVYGMTYDDLREDPPLVADMDVSTDNSGFEYDDN